VKPRRKSTRTFCAAAAVLCAGGLVGCTDGDRKVDARHELVVEYVPVPLDDEVNTVEGTCPSGSTLLGAGYRVDRATLDLRNAVAVSEHRPVGDNAWQVTVVRRPSIGPDEAKFSLYLYCLRRTDDADPVVTTQDRASSPVVLSAGASGTGRGTATVDCPANRTLVSGGFTVDLGAPDPTNTAATFNSWVFASLPGESAGSWEVEGNFIQTGGIRPAIRSFALCANDPSGVLDPLDAPDAAGESEGGFGFDFFAARARCPDRGFSTGGGYAFAGDPLVPRSVVKDQHLFGFSGWDVRGVYGFQPGDTAELTARPLCFRRVERSQPDQVDLVPLIGDEPLARSGCPGGASPCLTFTVVNAGTAASPATEAEVSVTEGAPARTAVPGLDEGETVELTVSIPEPCDDNCSASVTVDPDEQVTETDETNNTAQWFVVG